MEKQMWLVLKNDNLVVDKSYYNITIMIAIYIGLGMVICGTIIYEMFQMYQEMVVMKHA
jgi:hypothetical protein